jgi:4'-phosphopantetheinyl transferase
MMSLDWEAAPPPQLAPGEAQLFLVALDLPEAGVSALRAHLSPEEAARADRFIFPRDRRRFAVARGSLRELIARYTGRDPREAAFSYGPNGKPFAVAAGDLRFNLAHSGEYALFAFTRGREIGVDLEAERDIDSIEAMARRVFTREENAARDALPEAERRRAFFLGWSRKEAFMKLTGEGMQRSLESFAVSLTPRAPARLLSVDGSAEAAAEVSLVDLPGIPGFAAALAVYGPAPKLACSRWGAR